MKPRKIFAGPRLRALRQEHGLTQRQMAERLDISTAYVNQLENNQRPLTAPLMLGLAERFAVNPAELMDATADRLLADLNEALADPLFNDDVPALSERKAVTANSPGFARALLTLYQAYRKTSEQLTGADEAASSGTRHLPQTPYEEVRDFFHYADNYIDPLDRAAEKLAHHLFAVDSDAGARQTTQRPANASPPAPDRRLRALQDHLQETHGIRFTSRTTHTSPVLRHFDATSRTLYLNPRLPASSRFFQMAHQLALLEMADTLSAITRTANLKTPEARQICHIGLANYFAGALHMPYGPFLQTARDRSWDVEELARIFGASLEQVAHRLSTLQRDGQRGIPFFFARLDAAGTITKRHSATPLQFARFGGACPLWNVHRAFETRDEIIRQFAQTPDGTRYLCLAWSHKKSIAGYGTPSSTFAYALGCEISHAADTVYVRDTDLQTVRFEPIGISCRTCPRRDCVQRSVPPIAATIKVVPDRREQIPYEIT